MAISQRLEFRQSQSLVMTPQLMQAIKLLQMSNFELQAFVEAELERNPLLERDDRNEQLKAAEAVPADTVNEFGGAGPGEERGGPHDDGGDGETGDMPDSAASRVSSAADNR